DRFPHQLVPRRADHRATRGEILDKRQAAGWKKLKLPLPAAALGAVDVDRAAGPLQCLEDLRAELVMPLVKVCQQMLAARRLDVAHGLARQRPDGANPR